MSHIRQSRAHIRHANRAGGFPGGLGFNPFDPFPPTVDPVGEPTKTKKTATETPTESSASPTSASSATSLSIAAASSSAFSPSSAQASSSSPSPSSSTITTPTTTSHSSIPVTTTASGTALHNNYTKSKFVTSITSVTAHAAAADSSNSPAPAPTNALVAPVVGGVAGGIIGLALLVFLITWFMRRRRQDQDAINFDPGAFRRSAMLMTDPPTHQDTVERGYNPATPPTMVERRPIYTQASFDNTIGVGSPTSGSQLVFQAPYSPITAGPNVTSPVSAYDHHSWGSPAPVLTRNPSDSSAHSAHSQGPAQYPALPTRQNTMRNGQLAPPHNETEYLDLERTSVTPFQAEQYVEISKHLNAEVPRGLDTPTVNKIVTEKMDLPPLPPKDKENPFADASVPQEEVEDEGDSLPRVDDMSFPAPPSPVHTPSSRYARDRVESMPPTLPEIVVQPRVSVTSAYLSDASSAPGSQTVFMNVGKGPFAESPMGNRFPVTPSPLASSFTVPSPPAANTSFPASAPAAPEPAANETTAQVQARPDAKKRQTVYSTVYDPEDAYGGF